LKRCCFQTNQFYLLINEKSNFSFASNSFLLFTNDEYISKSYIDNDSDHELVTGNELNDFILKEKLKKINEF
jgi:hypothetical protein